MPSFLVSSLVAVVGALLLAATAYGQVTCPTVAGATLYVGSQGTTNQYTLASATRTSPATHRTAQRFGLSPYAPYPSPSSPAACSPAGCASAVPPRSANLSLFPSSSVVVACSAGTSASAFSALASGQVDALSINDDNSFYRQYDGLGAFQWLATQDNTLGHRILAVAGITNFLQLKGKNIAVDALVSGCTASALPPLNR